MKTYLLQLFYQVLIIIYTILPSKCVISINKAYLLFCRTITLFLGLLDMSAFFVSSIAALRASKTLHNNLIKTLLHVPLLYYDKTPLGRIINRLSDDLSTVDLILPFTLRSCVNAPLLMASTLLIIGWIVPWFMVLLPLFAIVYFFLQVIDVLTFFYFFLE